MVVETTDDLPNTEVLDNLLSFINELSSLSGRQPMVYTSPFFWQGLVETSQTVQTSGGSASLFSASEYPLWVANYTKGDQPSLPTGWGTWTFWQYSGEGQVPGIEGLVSLSRFNGTFQALENLASRAPEMSVDAGVETTSIIDLTTGEQVGASLPVLNPLSAALRPDGKLLAIGGENGAITFWDLAEGRQTEMVLVYKAASVNSLAFDASGSWLASGSADGSVVIWDLNTEKPTPIELSGHTSRVISLAFDPEGLILASGSADGSINLWDLETHNSIGQPIAGPASPVSALAISPDGTLLASGNVDGRVLLWDISPESWEARACLRIGRNLTESEWDKYLSGTTYRQTCP